MKINSVLPRDPAYPERLRHLSEVPAKLFYRGILPSQGRLHVAIVGTRKPTSYGREITERLAEGLARRGAVIVSGLALGVDAIAHHATTSVGGTTVAVLAGGVDNPSPYTNRQVAENILATGGALVSEYEPSTSPAQFRFLQRNRIVTGLSDILIVTEASDRSGTLNTVSHALAQGKDVYAVPGNLTSLTSRGCNRLIAQGATPIIDIDEFIETVLPTPRETLPLFAMSQEEETILHLIHNGSRDGDELYEKSGLSAASFAQTMTMLEINGAIKPLGGNHWTL